MEPKNFIHEHPLHFFEEWSNNVHGETRGVNCSSGCGQPISTQFYACIDCKFFLHKSCSELPLNITHPFHDKHPIHPLTLLAKAPYSGSCDFCGVSVNEFVYQCSSCKFDLDIKCALLLNGDFPKVDHHIHDEHPLFFIKNLSHEVKLASSRYCSVCLEQLSNASFYTCVVCELFLHKSCSETELPLNINHPFHKKHTLTLNFLKWNRAIPCQFCDNDHYREGLFYYCSSCLFKLHIKCALLPEFLNGDFPKVDHHIHEHPLFFMKNLSYEVKLASSRYCSVCLEQLSNASFYTCVVCELFLHKSCSETELPLNINHPFHEKHTLTLNLLKWDSEVLCQFCHNDHFREGLFYHCSSCRFNLHIKCAFLPQFLTGNFPIRDHHLSDVDEHPLFFIQKDLISNSNKIELHSDCFVCPESLSGSFFYYCPECQFFLHKSCVFEELPLKINHCFHEHSLTLKKSRDRPACKFCLNVIEGFSYSCSSCEFHLDHRCALLITKDLPKRDHHISHVEHPLVFVQMLSNEVKINSSCSVCSKPLLGTSFYNCPDCQFFFHKECEVEFPTKIKHFAHPQHPLIPRFSLGTCHFCQGKSDGKEIGYQCPSCDFYIHCKCILPRFVPESKIHDHDHQLVPFRRKNLFICDACGGSGNSAGYFCVKCNLMVHRDCILLPKTIKFKLHSHHRLVHNYWLPQKEGEKWTCQFCFKKVVAEYGSYKCLHSDCHYVLHASCVKENKGLYIEVESENEESDEASSSSSCAMVLGDKIKHFSHTHELALDKEEIIMNGDKKCCDGCALPILEAAYSCSQAECNFFLHQACAQIGEHKSHWASWDPLQVSMEFRFSCEFCQYDCSGFYCFERQDCREFCFRCSEIPFNPTHEAHKQHSLFCDKHYRGPCSGCGEEVGYYGGYKCTLAEEEEKCKFALDYRCLTRPLTAQHRFHHHPLKLTYEDPYKDKDDGDPFQHMCEICEDRRDPKLWFYRCDECDFDAHPDCVLGQFPFIKRGSIYNYYSSCDSCHRSLIYFQSEKYPYPKCDKCGNPCKDQLALKCPHSECNFARHFKDCSSDRQIFRFRRRWNYQ